MKLILLRRWRAAPRVVCAGHHSRAASSFAGRGILHLWHAVAARTQRRHLVDSHINRDRAGARRDPSAARGPSAIGAGKTWWRSRVCHRRGRGRLLVPHLEERGARLELLDDHSGGREHGEAAVLEPARNRPGESRNEFFLIEPRHERDTRHAITTHTQQVILAIDATLSHRTAQTRQTNNNNKQTTRDTHKQQGRGVFDAARDSLVCISLSASGSSGLRPRGSKSRSPGV